VDLARRYEAARRIAREAGSIAREYFEGAGDSEFEIEIEKKGLQDFVSVADREVERHIVEKLAAEFPTDAFFAEEGGGKIDSAVWLIDPIDGTTNFLRGIPLFCVSIAFVHAERFELGVIYDPMSEELFHARRGSGAFVDDVRLHTSHTHRLTDSLIGIGHSGRSDHSGLAKTLERLLQAEAEFRRLGTAALSLAYVARGHLDGFYEAHLNPWDAAAGLLLVEEAGGRTNDFLAQDGLANGNRCLATAAGIYEALDRLTVGR
jgi:myo-inositol-1(or 4)-monophosphatase